MRNKIIEIAQSQIGYREGKNNDTKYGTWYGLKNQPWCAMFVSWCANQAGIPTNIIPKFASCTQGFRAMKNTTRNKIIPQKGDLIFFKWQNDGTPDHVGLVEKVENGRVYTIEGNRSDRVSRFNYSLSSNEIYGYAKPNYQTISTPQVNYPLIKKGSKNNYVKIAQQKLIAKGYRLPKYGVDGYYGEETEQAVKQLQKDAGLEVDGICGKYTWGVLNSNFVRPERKAIYPGYLIKKGQQGENVRKVQQRLIDLGYNCGKYGADSIFGDATLEAVKRFQKDNKLSVDGIVGINTWNKLF